MHTQNTDAPKDASVASRTRKPFQDAARGGVSIATRVEQKNSRGINYVHICMHVLCRSIELVCDDAFLQRVRMRVELCACVRVDLPPRKTRALERLLRDAASAAALWDEMICWKMMCFACVRMSLCLRAGNHLKDTHHDGHTYRDRTRQGASGSGI